MTVTEEAEKYLNTAIQCFKNNDIERTKAYSSKAIEGYSKAIESGVHDKVIYKNRGIAYLLIENYAESIEDFTEALELGANDEFIYGNRGLAYLRLEDYPKAVEDFTKVIKLDENNTEAYASRGFAYAGVGDYAKAIEDFTIAIELSKDDISVYGARGYAYIYIGNYSKAIDDLTKVIVELDKNNTEAYYSRGFAYAGIGKYLEAIEDFTTAIKLGANDKDTYRDRGYAYACIGNYPEAIKDFTTAIEFGANDKVIYRNRGIAYAGIKDYPKAIEDFKEVIKLNKSGNEKNKNAGNSDYETKKRSLPDNILDLIFLILQSNELKLLEYNDVLYLIELISYCIALMDEIKIKYVEGMEEQFVHYTKASTLQFLLQKDHLTKLRLNNAVYMNDPEEGQILKKVLCQLDNNNELEKLFKDEDVKNYTYLTCFSPYDKRDELPMWIHYGDGGKGVGLVFHNSFFDEADLYKVQYMDVKNFDINKLDKNIRDKITPIFDFLKKNKNNTRKEFKDYVNIILNYISYLFKDKAYEYENEVRILKYRDYASKDIKTAVYESGIPRLFIEYDEYITDKNCVEVIAGPKAHYTEIAAYAKYVGIQKVSQSEIKYR